MFFIVLHKLSSVSKRGDMVSEIHSVVVQKRGPHPVKSTLSKKVNWWVHIEIKWFGLSKNTGGQDDCDYF